MKYNYSIIIPHHNIPLLLKRCLNSIPHRPDLQIIVIDDNSSPQCISELKLLEKEFPHVLFYYLAQGGGAGKARNIGLTQSKGEYILFADADDFFNYCLDEILSEYINSKYDVIYFNANSLDTNKYQPTWRNLYLSKMIAEYKNHPDKAIFKLKYVFGEPWCKLVKKELIIKNQITFDETNIHNDTKYSYLVGFYSQTIHVDERAIYCVTDRIGSISKQISPDRLLTRTRIFASANTFFKKHHIKRFDDRAIRPLLHFLLHADIKKAKQCYLILKQSQTSNLSILFRILFYPLVLVQKVIFRINKKLLTLLSQ